MFEYEECIEHCWESYEDSYFDDQDLDYCLSDCEELQ